ncbi:chemotaxis protein [Candidatus Photodesmus blepharus]|uniref:Chemotaxis protein n=1 Tax=Candidatus Photodesmus blepharonis TaxID=1179155 RepID=A0A084CMG5_9GAMM|nr:chemotaxis protein [Candidatus Photodesmus blepharus]
MILSLFGIPVWYCLSGWEACLLKSRLYPLIKKFNADSLSRDIIVAWNHDLRTAVDAMTINETLCFRDACPFVLSGNLLPETASCRQPI